MSVRDDAPPTSNEPGHRSRRASSAWWSASMAGTVVEWYEFFLYGTAATLVFSKVFFAEGDSDLDAILAAFVTYAVGFVARPLGGMVFGHFGDKYGRKKLLQFSLLLVGAATFLMGCLPTFGQIGYLGAGAAGGVAVHPGLRRRRRVGRRGPAGRRAQPEPAVARSGPAGRRPACPSATCSPPSCCWC